MKICDRRIGSSPIVGLALHKNDAYNPRNSQEDDLRNVLDGDDDREKQLHCPMTRHKRLALISGWKAYGRTGNHLESLLHALQYSVDEDVTIGVMYHSWAASVILSMWFATGNDVSNDGNEDGNHI